MGTWPQWLQAGLTGAAFLWAVYLYLESRRDKRSAQPKLVYALPENAVLLSGKKNSIGRSFATNLIDTEDIPSIRRQGDLWYSDEDAIVFFATVHNNSNEVVHDVTVMIRATQGDGPNAYVASYSLPYLPPGAVETVGAAVERMTFDPHLVRIDPVVHFSDANRHHWKHDPREGLFLESRKSRAARRHQRVFPEANVTTWYPFKGRFRR